MSQINFLPPAYLQQRSRRHGSLRQCALLVLVAVVMIGWYLDARRELPVLRALAADMDRRKSDLELQSTAATRFTNRLSVLTHEVGIQRELTQAVNYSALLATISKIMPAAMAVTDIRVLAKRPPPTKPKKSVNSHNKSKTPVSPGIEPWQVMRVILDGVAPSGHDVANFVGALEAHPLFDQIKIEDVRATRIGDLKARRFTIRFRIRLDRDVRPTDAQGSVASARDRSGVTRAD